MYASGATLSKGLNRGIETVLGGGLGCLLVVLANAVGGVGTGIIIMTSVFLCGNRSSFMHSNNLVVCISSSNIDLSGAVATYTRLVPCIKRKYDYGAMIFILTFNLIVVSGVRTVSIVELACQRLSTIGIGFAIAVFTSTFITPVWTSDRLHSTLASHFKTLACCLEDSISIPRSVSERESVTAVVGSISWSLNELGQSIANMKRCKGHALSEDRLEVITNKLSHAA
ncbi:hypothetical protein Droror1_Dr00007941 [Drosera rotundifolia]